MKPPEQAQILWWVLPTSPEPASLPLKTGCQLSLEMCGHSSARPCQRQLWACSGCLSLPESRSYVHTLACKVWETIMMFSVSLIKSYLFFSIRLDTHTHTCSHIMKCVQLSGWAAFIELVHSIDQVVLATQLKRRRSVIWSTHFGPSVHFHLFNEIMACVLSCILILGLFNLRTFCSLP